MAETRQGTDSVIPPEVEELIERSQTIRGWIDRLREHEGETSPAVYEKVLADYRERLEGVTTDLRTHRTDLVETLERHRAEVEALRGDREDHAARLEEARLRHAVGEFDDDEWEDRREGIEATLSDLDERLTSEGATVDELEGILAAIPGEGEATPEEAGPWTARAGAAPESAGEEAVEEPAAAAAPKGGAGVAAGPDADDEAGAGPAEAAAAEKEAEEKAGATAELEEAELEEAELEEESAAEGEEEEASTAAAEEPRAAASGAEGESYLDELEFLESLSLDEADRFDAVSAMLDEDEGGERASE